MIESVVTEYFGFTDGMSKTVCPPGNAENCFDLTQRGHNEWPQITVWPKNEHYRLTTGRESGTLGIPQPVALNEAEKQMCAILGLNELELGIFLREWTIIAQDTLKRRPQTLEEISRALTREGK